MAKISDKSLLPLSEIGGANFRSNQPANRSSSISDIEARVEASLDMQGLNAAVKMIREMAEQHKKAV